jgi:dynein heavy chain, axonemal
VLSETLFDLEISNYQTLNDMIERNKVYDQIYDIYKKHREAVKEWSMLPWSKLDIQALEMGANAHEKMVKKLQNNLKMAESYPPFIKLRTTVQGFKGSLPLIQELKHPAVQERHWKRIMDETGKDLGDINLKTITLAKVFDLELQNYQEKVQEICKEAKEELKNEDAIAKIDATWKATNFDIAKYVKGTEHKGYVIKSPDEIRTLLEDNILQLQGVGASKYARSIKGKVIQWEADLNLISDCIDAWMIVQRKWQYLESIFASDDIRQQLPEEAKKFQKTDGNYRKIMDGTSKTLNVLQCCVKAEGGKRLDELKNISFELDKCQKSLTNYLDSKKGVFPRFYFISDEDLLQILGSADPKNIQSHLLKLFDNAKEVTFGQGNKIITHMTSDEGEKYAFETPCKPDGKIEDWMTRLDEEMKRTLHIFVKREVFNYAKEERVAWISRQIGMIGLVGTQIWWTFAIEDVFRRLAAGDKHAMKNELLKETKDVNDLIALVRTDIDSNLRKLVNTMIILDVHARDIIETFVRDSVMFAKEFEWESQLRFYWDNEKDDIDIR